MWKYFHNYRKSRVMEPSNATHQAITNTTFTIVHETDTKQSAKKTIYGQLRRHFPGVPGRLEPLMELNEQTGLSPN